MAETDRRQLEERLRGGLRRLLDGACPSGAALVQVVERIRSRGWSAALFGGSLGDLVIGTSPVAPPRDFDVMVAGVSVQALEAAFTGDVQRRTRFGGLHLAAGGMPFDVWPLEQTWAFQTGQGQEPSFAELPRTTFLNVEAVVAEITGPGAGTIHDGGAFEAALSRTLEINFEPNPSPLQCVVRSLVTAARLEFAIGPRLARYLAAHGAALGGEALAEARQAHDGNLPWGAEDFRRWLDALAEWVSSGVDTAVDLRALDRWRAAPPRSSGRKRGVRPSDRSSRS